MSAISAARAAAVALLTVVSSCSRDHMRAIVADAPLQVLERPSPMDYPSTAPEPNRVLATVPAGERLVVIGRGYEKDYAYYRVELADGRKGYVINRTSALHEEE